MTYQEAMNFIEETKKYGSVLGLDSIRALMAELGDVQDKLPIIHVAGTNGKGSVSSFMAAIYRCAGYHVCRFATPDVFSYEEEFLYDDEPISRDELAQVFKVVRQGCDRMVSKGNPHPTRFEVETGAAFLWFSMKKPDICIIEVGMGGETDATNVISAPLASVLTSISRDHVGFLGNSLADITKVKAGIIKPSFPVVSTWQEPEVKEIIQKISDEKGSPVFFSKKTDRAFSYELSLKGTFQKQNAILALDVINVLQERYPVSEEAIRKGFSSARWPGRFELLGTEPDFYIDGAHNVGAAKNLRETIDTYLGEQRVIYIMGVLEDKDYEEIAEMMFQEGDIVYCITPDNPRALSARELCDELLELDVRAYELESVEKAVVCAVELAELTDGAVVAFGSLSYLKEVKKFYEIYR